MNVNRNQIYGGTFAIVAGLATLLGRFVGFQKIGFLYPLAAGVLMIVAPWDGTNARATRIAGVWVGLTGVIGGLVTFTDLGWHVFVPLYMVAGGLITIFFSKREATQ